MIPGHSTTSSRASDAEEEYTERDLTVDKGRPLEDMIFPRLIICEGNSDKAVVDVLTRSHGISGAQTDWTGGRTNFNKFLRAAKVKGFKWVLLLADGDDKPQQSFDLVCEELRKAKYSCPTALDRRQQVQPKDGLPGFEIVMLPGDKDQGSLETVCLPALKELYPSQYACLEQFCNCTGAAGWTSKTRLDEMKVHCLISSTQPDRPRIGLKFFAESSSCPLDFKHKCFDQLVSDLRRFSTYPV